MLMNSSFFLGSVAAAIVVFMLFRKFRFQQDNKDTKSSYLSPPSPLSSSLSRIWKHDVFPSFHGPDFRRTFFSHVREEFKGMGIDIFIDNHIQRGKSIGSELVEAIRGSKIAIILLSKNYASSSWCLDELAEIIKCREVLGQIVLTIFYEVEPTHVRKQTGDFGKAFRKSCQGKTKEHIERWRKALEDVAKIAGEHSRNWDDEADMIKKIATNVSNMLIHSSPSRDFDSLVGMRAHMEMMKPLLSLDLDEVRMIGIWGPPGIGKSTIARFLFNQVSSRFQLGAIMVNVKACYPTPCLDEYSAQLQLQNQMLSQIIKQKDIMISHLGVAQERLKDKKVFLVLDDVDRVGQLVALAKETQWFGLGSRIIITTEDVRVLKAHGIKHIYKVKFPSDDKAFQIFCMHAFGQKHPDDDFYELATEFTSLAGKLPLGLKILGSALHGMSKQEWERRLPGLKTRLDGNIKSIIKFSYDALEDEEKYLFLYIACLCSLLISHKVEELLAKQIKNVKQSLDILAEKSLISINDGGIVRMHTLLVQFGRETSREQFVHGRVKRQLLVGERNICEILGDDTTDSRRFIGIDLDLSNIEDELNISEKGLERMSDLQFLSIYGDGVAHSEKLYPLLYHSQKIRSLHWKYFQDICLPSTFNPEFLVELVMVESNLQKLWDGTKPLKNLKWMDLSSSTNLRELPDLSIATNLQELNLFNCSSLVELPTSIGKLTRLRFLNLSRCSSLVELPSSIGKLTSLQKLHLTKCSSLIELPSSIGNATNLQMLYLCDCSSLVELPTSIGKLTSLLILDLTRCSSLIELPSSIGNATNLQEVNLGYCSSLVKLPSSIKSATNLKELYLSDCSSLLELPSIENATKLERLYLSNCISLVKLPSSINATNLRILYLENCSRVVELPAIENATNLERLVLNNCSNLRELPPIGTARNLQELDISGCLSLVKLPSSINATNLRILSLKNCSCVVELPAIENATNLEWLELNNCSHLRELPPSIGTARKLHELNISGCSGLVKLPSSIGDVTNLIKFHLSGCSNLVELPPSIGNLHHLKWLDMRECSKLEALPTNINFESLERLDITNCSQWKSFPELSTKIWSLSLIGTAIKEIPLSIMSWSRLSDFCMSYFESLKEFPHALDTITELQLNEDIQEVAPWVNGMSRLHKLRLHNCNNLVSLSQFSDSLSFIDAENCKSLERLDCFFNNRYIRLKFSNCFKLNQEARDLIMHTSTCEYAILPGTQVPACFDYRATAGGPLTIKLNERHLSTPIKFKACIVLVMDREETNDDKPWMTVDINIMDKQNDLSDECTPIHIKELLTEHIYTFEVESWEVTSTELVFEFNTESSKWKIGECGLYQILEVSEHDESLSDGTDDWEDRDDEEKKKESKSWVSCVGIH